MEVMSRKNLLECWFLILFRLDSITQRAMSEQQRINYFGCYCRCRRSYSGIIVLFDDDDIGARNRKVVDVNVRCHIVAARKTQVGCRREKNS